LVGKLRNQNPFIIKINSKIVACREVALMEREREREGILAV
jgi:hypothetical protein